MYKEGPKGVSIQYIRGTSVALASDMRNGFLPSIIFCTTLLVSIGGHAIEMEYISPEKKQELERQFEKAEFSSKAAVALKQKQWTCDMYGVRTRLQVKRGIKLYNWKDQADWSNSGAQVVRNYKAEDGRLIGSTGSLEDQVKLNSNGQIISRLSLTRPDRQVVAYAVCDTP